MNNYKSRKGKKPYRGKSQVKDESPNSKDRVEKPNDPNWYIRHNQLAKDVASLSFNNALGARTYLSDDAFLGTHSPASFYLSIPGIMSILTAPSVGYSEAGNSPVNIAAKNLYSFVRHQNSGHANYDSPDLMLYICAMDSLYSCIAHLTRAYGTALVYSQTNRYVGDAMLTAMGFDPYEVRTELADFRAFINMAIVKASAFCVPNTMTMFLRHQWMYSTIYQDSPVTKCQYYMYTPAIAWKYNELSGAGKCEAVLTPAGGNNIDTSTVYKQYCGASVGTLFQWRSFINDMLDRLTGSEDINIMSGDILKAYGRENLFTLGAVPENFPITPFYSEEVLDQIHNTIFSGNAPRVVTDLSDASQCTTNNLTTLDVTQNTSIGNGALLFTPQFAGASHLSYTHVLDMCDNDPTPERILVGTRNMIGGEVFDTSIDPDLQITRLTSMGSDICMTAYMWYYDNAGSLLNTNYDPILGVIGSTVLTQMFTKFNKSPLYYTMTTGTAQNPKRLYTLLGEIGNYTVINKDDLNKIHESAILSMYGVPV